MNTRSRVTLTTLGITFSLAFSLLFFFSWASIVELFEILIDYASRALTIGGIASMFSYFFMSAYLKFARAKNRLDATIAVKNVWHGEVIKEEMKESLPIITAAQQNKIDKARVKRTKKIMKLDELEDASEYFLSYIIYQMRHNLSTVDPLRLADASRLQKEVFGKIKYIKKIGPLLSRELRKRQEKKAEKEAKRKRERGKKKLLGQNAFKTS